MDVLAAPSSSKSRPIEFEVGSGTQRLKCEETDIQYCFTKAIDKKGGFAGISAKELATSIAKSETLRKYYLSDSMDEDKMVNFILECPASFYEHLESCKYLIRTGCYDPLEFGGDSYLYLLKDLSNADVNVKVDDYLRLDFIQVILVQLLRLLDRENSEHIQDSLENKNEISEIKGSNSEKRREPENNISPKKSIKDRAKFFQEGKKVEVRPKSKGVINTGAKRSVKDAIGYFDKRKDDPNQKGTIWRIKDQKPDINF